MGALQTVTKGVRNPLFSEATAALEFARDMGFTSVILEGDALEVIKQITQSTEDLSDIGILVDECRSMVKTFNCCIVLHVNREANNMTHSLAKSVLVSKDLLYWIEECPPMLLILIKNK